MVEAAEPAPPASPGLSGLGGLQPHLHHLWTLLRFGLVGALNSAVGFAIIAGLQLGLKVHPHLANAAGYVVGMTIGFTLNHGFVFRSDGHIARTGVRYFIAVGIGFAVNQLVLAVALRLYGDMAVAKLAAQLTAMAAYTVLVFALCKLWVFKPDPPAD